ncbi:MAG: hypothetical protein Q7R79_02730 [bacterium]|nr:hypothetical protein [bacterium]
MNNHEESLIDKHLYIRVIEYGINKADGFTVSELYTDKKAFLSEHDKKTLESYFEFAYTNARQVRTYGKSGSSESLFLLTNKGGGWNDNNSRYAVSLDAIFKYLEYQELKFARQNAREARDLSIKAIAISAGAVIISIFVPIFVAQFISQSVQIEDGQFQFFKSVIKQ